MPAGYSGTPLIKKLGIKEGAAARIIGAPDGFARTLGSLPAQVRMVRGTSQAELDFILLFTKREAELAKKLPGLAESIVPNGMIWIAWPKRTSGVATDLTEDVVRKVAFASELVDIKVCAIDEIWSGLKLVIPVKRRPKR